MASLHRLLKDYQQLLSLSQKILHLAVSGQWDTLVEQEIVYVQSVEGLVNTPIPDEIDSVMRLHLRQILQEVMDNEAKVKQLLQKRMDELSSLMGQSLKQKSINTTYSEFAGKRLLPGEPAPGEPSS
ncbi:flagella biosynthesis regulatory protein FliT [Pectobacterium odoriferum]|uniref:Flagellar protein FliT n=1 Tax=Pectobacterium odoriferum TaxID=78398 RepID=A0ABD6VJX3_9GAMM|nr:flagella biosynthesis regulatory protein FliT [Pectobacterium odoriferum]AIU88912.1 flagellar biosynthesis protein FliT [Pectobacterium odoriferum]KGA41326.1 flagellar biosynthesis protein FliT [Pectobacterium odoriferum]MBA0189948.1 flagella biosynthesis regulatory protein FliT [Pectobacterium odoriferum]MCA6961947.1 flagella biosynthesis regulatory protein FliT [Pectobacterium odoriferum]MCH5010048.1 flagella biosynthesis regulatory protein FliT [Pectobacterium odoriferum]